MFVYVFSSLLYTLYLVANVFVLLVISTPLAFHFVFACLLTTVLLVAIVFVIVVGH